MATALNIRNFAIIAHVDHGKSTLADRFLEITKTIPKDKMQEQFLDQNPISRERGITIKLAPVRMAYEKNGKTYALNLIDTPGHVDFSYEVSRTLAACEGAILLVDATQGVQAQTVAHFHAAKKEKLTIIPVVNKIDLPGAKISEAERELLEIFSFQKEEILRISAKTGEGVNDLLDQIIERFPPPEVSDDKLRALIFDAFYDEHRGVIVYLRIFNGSLKKNDRISFYEGGTDATASEVGYFTPFLSEKERLSLGEIGYVVTGIKDIRLSSVGDTIYKKDQKIDPLPGYEKPKPMIFFGLYPKDPKHLGKLRETLNKISLNDTAISFSDEYSTFLGSGFRVGFLGLLHADIVRERIEREENLAIFLTQPRVLYEEDKEGIKEPYIKLTVYAPKQFVGSVINLCENRRGKLLDISYFQNNAVLMYELPYTMFIRGISSDLKSVSSGFASLDYEPIGYKKADLVDLTILVNGLEIDVLSEKVYREEGAYKARQKAKNLKENLPRQQFRQIIQVKIDQSIVAREEIPPFRKDVLAKMSGGDRTRKDKLLEKQKKGKEKMFSEGKIGIPQEVLFSLIDSS